MTKVEFNTEEISRALFRVSSSSETKLGKVRYGIAQPKSGTEYWSRLRPRSAVRDAKVSLIAQLIDRIGSNDVHVYEISHDNIVIKIEHTEYIFIGKVSANSSGWQVSGHDYPKAGAGNREMDVRDAIFASATSLFALRSDEMSDNLVDYFKALKKGNPQDKSLFVICDSYYYNLVGNKLTVTMTDDESIKDQLTVAMDGGLVEFNDLRLPEVVTSDMKKPKKKAAKKSDETAENVIDDIYAGKYRINYDWDDEQKAAILPLDILDTYYPTPDFVRLLKTLFHVFSETVEQIKAGVPAYKIRTGRFNAMLFGSPGTGKSQAVECVSAALGIPYAVTQMSKHSEENEYEGKTLIKDHEAVFVPTDFAKFFGKGAILNIEEPNTADPAVNMKLATALASKKGFIDVNGDKVYRSPMTVVLACENAGIEGTRSDSPAFSNRFGPMFHFADPTDDDFKNILVKMTGQSKALCAWVYNVYKKTIKWLESEEIGEGEVTNWLSLRTCEAAIELMEFGAEPKEAIVSTLSGAIGHVDQELEKDYQKQVLSDLPECRASVR